jgi:flagellar basal-body rod protein FlgC
MSLTKAMDILSSGLHAQRIRMNITSSNLANAHTTRTVDGTPFRRKDPVFESSQLDPNSANFDNTLQKVQVTGVKDDLTPFPEVYDPGHPDADAKTGMVKMPNVNVVEEMVNLITSSRSYEANVTAFETLKQMAVKAMDIGR